MDNGIHLHFTNGRIKRKLELKSNLSEILLVNCILICVCIFLFYAESQT